MYHRGPDDAGIWQSPDGRVGLAHRRLAIVDLSPSGHQPMMDGSQQFCLIFNGEIYNYLELKQELADKGHHFQSTSDTEVILEAYRAWGTDCLAHFNGMFAFGLYDLTQHKLFLARDRAGEKPLFYYHSGETTIFASELKALLADPAFPRRLNLEALEYYLAYGYVPGDKCILQGVHKLPPAHALTYDLASGSRKIWRYWQLPEPAPQSNATAEELVEELETLLLDSVRLRLHADVSVGILLSGGIDSSLVTALAARVAERPVQTFTISFPGHGFYDEGPYARMVARHFATRHVELAAEPASVELLPELARQYDEPLADSAILPTYLVSRLIRPQATVALGGDGGDELFGGYDHYSLLQWEERLRHFLPSPLRRWTGAGAARLLPPGWQGRNHLIGFSGDLAHSIAHVNIYFDAFTRRRLLLPRGGKNRPAMAPETYKSRLCSPGLSPLQQATRVDFQTTMADGYLVKVDRASMLTSLEVRAPWLDHRIIELAFSRVPDHLRATASRRKVLPRLLAQRLLPAELDLSRKQGFRLPLDTWFQGEWGRFTEKILSEANPDLFDQQTIRRLIAGQHRGYPNTNRLFALTMFELWRREYRVTLPE